MRDNSLDIEKQRVAERLISLETSIATLVKVSEIRVETDRTITLKMQENIEKLNYIVNGNGKPGLAEEVRRLKEVDLNRKTHNRVFYTAIIAGCVEWFWRTLGQHLFR